MPSYRGKENENNSSSSTGIWKSHKPSRLQADTLPLRHDSPYFILVLDILPNIL